MPTCLSRQTSRHVTIFKRSGTRKCQGLLLEKNYFVLGLLARDIANHSFQHTCEPGLLKTPWVKDWLVEKPFRLTSGWNVWPPGRQLSLVTVPKFADNLLLSPYHGKYLHRDLNWGPFVVPLVPKWGREKGECVNKLSLQQLTVSSFHFESKQQQRQQQILGERMPCNKVL